MPPKCTICHHSDHEAIDQALVSDETLLNISHRFTVSRGALYRHKAHISTAVAKAHEANEVAEANRLLVMFKLYYNVIRAIRVLTRLASGLPPNQEMPPREKRVLH